MPNIFTYFLATSLFHDSNFLFYLFKNIYYSSDDKKIYLQCRRPQFSPWVWKSPWRREWQPIPVFLPRKFHAQTMGSKKMGHN